MRLSCSFLAVGGIWLIMSGAALSQPLDNNSEVRVNPLPAGPGRNLLYPGGEYSRSVPQLLYPGERRGPISLHMPSSHAARRTVAEAQSAPPAGRLRRKRVASAAKPAPQAAPPAPAPPPEPKRVARAAEPVPQPAPPAPAPPPEPKRVASAPKPAPPPAPPAPAPPPEPKRVASAPKPAPPPAPSAPARPASGQSAQLPGIFGAPDYSNVFGNGGNAPQRQASNAPPPPPRTAPAAPPPPRTAPAGPTTGNENLTKKSMILFAKNATDPAAGAMGSIKFLAGELNAAMTKPNARIELQAFGGAKGDKGSDARRLSLKRALAIRQVLIDDGVSPDRIDVRAMGGVDDTGPTDRVDVYTKA